MVRKPKNTQKKLKLKNPDPERVIDFKYLHSSDLQEMSEDGLKLISEGKLAVIIDFSTFDQDLNLDVLKLKHRPKWALDLTILEYYLIRIKSIGRYATQKFGMNHDQGRDPILVLLQCNDMNMEEIDDFLVNKRYFGYQGLICFTTVSLKNHQILFV